MNALKDRIQQLFTVSSFRAVRTPTDRVFHLIRQAGQWLLTIPVTVIFILVAGTIYLKTKTTHK